MNPYPRDQWISRWLANNGATRLRRSKSAELAYTTWLVREKILLVVDSKHDGVEVYLPVGTDNLIQTTLDLLDAHFRPAEPET